MKGKILILMFLTCLVISPVLADDYKAVSITYGGDQFISLPSDADVTYSYTSGNIPTGGVLLLSTQYNDTYIIRSGNSAEFVTVNKYENISDTGFVTIILGWLGL